MDESVLRGSDSFALFVVDGRQCVRGVVCQAAGHKGVVTVGTFYTTTFKPQQIVL